MLVIFYNVIKTNKIIEKHLSRDGFLIVGTCTFSPTRAHFSYTWPTYILYYLHLEIGVTKHRSVIVVLFCYGVVVDRCKLCKNI